MMRLAERPRTDGWFEMNCMKENSKVYFFLYRGMLPDALCVFAPLGCERRQAQTITMIGIRLDDAPVSLNDNESSRR